MPQKSKQEVWHYAQLEEVDRFIAAIAKAFPDAIEVVHVQSNNCNVWCYAKTDVQSSHQSSPTTL
jgi:hypothetical protein